MPMKGATSIRTKGTASNEPVRTTKQSTVKPMPFRQDIIRLQLFGDESPGPHAIMTIQFPSECENGHTRALFFDPCVHAGTVLRKESPRPSGASDAGGCGLPSPDALHRETPTNPVTVTDRPRARLKSGGRLFLGPLDDRKGNDRCRHDGASPAESAALRLRYISAICSAAGSKAHLP